jgi:carbamate kinase
MVNFFMVGSEMVRWEITSMGQDVCRLMITHTNGTIVEYFRTAAQALDRQKDIEALFLEARGAESLPQ